MIFKPFAENRTTGKGLAVFDAPEINRKFLFSQNHTINHDSISYLIEVNCILSSVRRFLYDQLTVFQNINIK